jgi:hypothetical protein
MGEACFGRLSHLNGFGKFDFLVLTVEWRRSFDLSRLCMKLFLTNAVALTLFIRIVGGLLADQTRVLWISRRSHTASFVRCIVPGIPLRMR